MKVDNGSRDRSQKQPFQGKPSVVDADGMISGRDGRPLENPAVAHRFGGPFDGRPPGDETVTYPWWDENAQEPQNEEYAEGKFSDHHSNGEITVRRLVDASWADERELVMEVPMGVVREVFDCDILMEDDLVIFDSENPRRCQVRYVPVIRQGDNCPN